MKIPILILKIILIIASIWCLMISLGPVFLVALFGGSKSNLFEILKLQGTVTCILVPVATIIWLVALRYTSEKTALFLSILPIAILVFALVRSPILRASIAQKTNINQASSTLDGVTKTSVRNYDSNEYSIFTNSYFLQQGGVKTFDHYSVSAQTVSGEKLWEIDTLFASPLDARTKLTNDLSGKYAFKLLSIDQRGYHFVASVEGKAVYYGVDFQGNVVKEK